MTKSNIQIRGNCQICGRDHAFIGAKMAQHGYTVEYGFFNGVCDGHKYLPVQKDITKLRQVQEHLRTEGQKNIERAEKLIAGKIRPEFVTRKTYPNGRHRDAVVEMIKWEDCPTASATSTASTSAIRPSRKAKPCSNTRSTWT